jgi:AbrB family looped-hinge helix DNA binding protein
VYVQAETATSMSTTTLSTKGQVVIPGVFRKRHHWQPGQTLTIEDTDDGVILRVPPTRTALRSLVGIAGYRGRTRSLEDMEAAIGYGAKEHHDRD